MVFLLALKPEKIVAVSCGRNHTMLYSGIVTKANSCQRETETETERERAETLSRELHSKCNLKE